MSNRLHCHFECCHLVMKKIVTRIAMILITLLGTIVVPAYIGYQLSECITIFST
ncbi:Uncharacterised protein [Photobacterium damselae]|uniref:Uncharacterized protein n=1 Tax=Photobacterium damselae TaxID=38293 RepID=A0A2X1XPW1_PHODM|nr:Uncharacterised protein [Photobacterium damselae]